LVGPANEYLQTTPIPARRPPPDIISYAVWLYYRFNLSHRDVEDLLAERGITVSYESIRLWCIKFGPKYARRLKRKHRGYGDTFYIDEVFVKINGKHGAIGRVLYYRALGDRAIPGFNASIYLGASLEAGNVWQDTNDIAFDNTLVAGSLSVAFDTLVGPIYIAYGAAEGGRQSAYLFIGQTF
jgi:hypothetical protein